MSSPCVENVFDKMQKTANAVNEIIILTSSFITRLNSLKYCMNVGILFLILAAATPINNENISKWIMLPSVSDLKILLGKKFTPLLRLSVNILSLISFNNIGS